MPDRKFYIARNILYVVIMFGVLVSTYYVRDRQYRFSIYGGAVFLFLLGYYLLNRAWKRRAGRDQ